MSFGPSFEFNKLFAAVLVAGIAAMLSGFIAENVVHSHTLEKNAVEIKGEAADHGGKPAKVQRPAPVLHLVAAVDVEKGKKLSKACAACHSFEKGGPIKMGPNLWNVVGSNKGGKSGFGYSSGMMEMGGSWTYADLNKFLWKPKKFVSGTKMGFIGLKKPQDRAAVIAWLRTLSDSPKALPGASEIAAESAELLPEKIADIAPEAGEMIEEIINKEMLGPPAPEQITSPPDIIPEAGVPAETPIIIIPGKKPAFEQAPRESTQQPN